MSDAMNIGDAAPAFASLRGLALGDSFGERWFFRGHREALEMIQHRTTPGDQPWQWTDDTVMALALLRVLTAHGEVLQQELATEFASMYAADPYRGFGSGMHDLLPKLGEDPGNWATYARTLFGGQGSLGNGAAMRAAPLGAWFWRDPELAVAQAALAAEVTHAHPEGVAGGVAVAAAAALAAASAGSASSGAASADAAAGSGPARATDAAARSGAAEAAMRSGAADAAARSGAAEAAAASAAADTAARSGPAPDPHAFLAATADLTPPGPIRNILRRAADLPPETPVRKASEILGNGRRVRASDTAPFAIWSAAHHLDNLVGALWTTAEGLGDVDTTCAITGGIVAARTGMTAVPARWLELSEKLPEWVE
jgi:ADP-ribosylglycohydrolase